MDDMVPQRRGRRPSDRPQPAGGLFPGEQDEGVSPAVATPPGAVKPTSGHVTSIRSRYPARIILIAPSGTRYEWGQAGDAVGVSDEDLAFVLAKNRGAKDSCCGGGERIVFETV